MSWVAGRRAILGVLGVAVLLAGGGCWNAGQGGGSPSGGAAGAWERVLLLRDYNTRVVVFSTTLLGSAAGMVGSYTLLRRRALLGDALSHSTLPGIALAFLIGSAVWGGGKSLPWLLCGATTTGLLGMGTILAIRRGTRLKDDAAMGIVLSVFFGAGIALFGLVQQLPHGHAAGLESFILGKTAAMGMRDAWLIGSAAALSIGISVVWFKELTLLCFDESFAAALGLPTRVVDWLLMTLLVGVTIVGLQAVGLILMIALLVIPPAAARFWTESAWWLLWLAGVLGGLGGLLGAVTSGLVAELPSGPMIVLVCAGLFLLSLLCGTARGLVVRGWRRIRLQQRIERQHLLRALYEGSEQTPLPAGTSAGSSLRSDGEWITRAALLTQRSWSPWRLAAVIRRAAREGLVEPLDAAVRLTRRGQVEAARVTREHRLWELFLIRHAEMAPSHVDRGADAIEHVLQPEVVAELAALLDQPQEQVPESPHALAAPQGGERSGPAARSGP